jgi:hypothetical protein
MRPHSRVFADAIARSHRLATSAMVNGKDVLIIDGTVTLDSSAAVRGRCDVTVADDGSLGLVPDSPSSLLAPYGNEIALARGLFYPDGSTELVGLGVFGIQSAEVTDSTEGMQIRIAGLDRSARIIDARFEAPYQITAGTNYAIAIANTLHQAWGDLPINFASTDLRTPTLIAQEGDDRWEFCQQMATAISMSLYFDGDGVCVLTPITSTDPVATISEGKDGVLLEADRNWTREGTYNRVIATGENTGETMPVRGVATDDDPFSPTYYFGPFGRVPRFYSSPFITTVSQANAAAQSILQNELGTTEQVNFGSLVLPYLEPGDVLRITRQRAGIDEEHMLTSLTIPLSAAASMSGQTRASRVAYVYTEPAPGPEPEAGQIMAGSQVILRYPPYDEAIAYDQLFSVTGNATLEEPAGEVARWAVPVTSEGMSTGGSQTYNNSHGFFVYDEDAFEDDGTLLDGWVLIAELVFKSPLSPAGLEVGTIRANAVVPANGNAVTMLWYPA